jgi:lipoprotein-releasing system ATP-binding protein
MGDELTENLNKKNEILFNIFQELATEFKQTLLIVTHDEGFAEKTNRIIHMEDGSIVT